MIGLATYAATKQSFLGIDWANLASGVLKGAGGAFGGGGGGDAAAMMEKMRLEQQRLDAEKSARNWKLAAIAAIVGVGGYFVFRHKGGK